MIDKIIAWCTVILNVLVVFAFTGVVGLIVAFPIMWLWNSSLSALFEVPHITFWQAWFLYLLINIFASAFHFKTES